MAELKSREEIKDVEEFAKFWHDVIDQAKKLREATWKDADNARDTYIQQTRNSFNILYSNVETRMNVRYNSVPIPDVRPRHFDLNPQIRQAGRIIERALTQQMEGNSFDDNIRNTIKCEELTGLGQVRLLWETFDTEEEQNGQVQQTIPDERVRVVYVPHKHYLEGPAHTWDEVKWVAFKLFLTKDEIKQLAPNLVEELQYNDSLEPDEETASENQLKSDLKVVPCWQIWDKDSKAVITIAENYNRDIVDVKPPGLKLYNFFPCPKPLIMVTLDGSRIPKVPYEFYRYQAETLEVVSTRIRRLSKILKFRGLYASELAGDLKKIEDLDDGEFAATGNALAVLQQVSDLKGAVWTMPIEELVKVIRELTVIEQHLKQVIYEITGISDIMRGNTQEYETARAQSIKAEWGSLRITDSQQEVQRFIRDVLRLMGEIIGDNFQTSTLQTIYQGEIAPEVLQYLQSDYNRKYAIDIETDSTIRGDIGKFRENMNQFLDATAKYTQVMGPLVQQNMVPKNVVIKIFAGFAAQHNLGKQVEIALDDFLMKAEQTQEQDEEKVQEEQEQQKQMMMQQQQGELQKLQMEIQKLTAEIKQIGARTLESFIEGEVKIAEAAKNKISIGEAVSKFKDSVNQSAERNGASQQRNKQNASE